MRYFRKITVCDKFSLQIIQIFLLYIRQIFIGKRQHPHTRAHTHIDTLYAIFL